MIEYFIAAGLLQSHQPSSLPSYPAAVYAQGPLAKPEPPYAKWGKLAVAETARRYPQANVVDYLHIGRHTVAPNRAQETFKLWLRQGDKEWGVYVRIVFDENTEAVSSIQFTETTM